MKKIRGKDPELNRVQENVDSEFNVEAAKRRIIEEGLKAVLSELDQLNKEVRAALDE